MSFFIPRKNFTHLYIIQQNLKNNLRKSFHQNHTLPNQKPFYISIIKIPRIKYPYTFP